MKFYCEKVGGVILEIGSTPAQSWETYQRTANQIKGAEFGEIGTRMTSD
ncbi:hypothetical protein T03_1708 [Trichinella britovi]|uniref:Uncharacterized protein n=1 Tax=Trichinella britovi TaxID=45882 RepID=A0A0V1CW92_TRIBR|nr:hypothetical protein T03_1708 [Trichinella britovi]